MHGQLPDHEQHDVPPPHHTEWDAVVFDLPPNKEEAARQRREDEQHEFARQQVETNRWLTRFTGALVFATFCTIAVGIWQASIYHAQLTAMQGQLDEMKRTGEQSTEQTWSAIGNINWMARSADWSQKESKLGIESSERQSKAELDATIANFRQEQRAWLGAQDFTDSLPEKGQVWSSAWIVNTGKSPAMNIVCRSSGFTRDAGHVLKTSDFVYPSSLPEIKQGTIFPNQRFPLKTLAGPELDEAKQTALFNNVKARIWTEYLFGEVRYRDTFGKLHWTHFCTELAADLTSGTPCPIYNDTDDNKDDEWLPQRKAQC